MIDKRKALGLEGEALAAGYLKKQGYRILAQNYTTPSGEIDIIAKKDGVLVFVEVKTRADEGYLPPYISVGQKKIEKIRKTALSYIRKLRPMPKARFDVISIIASTGRIEHIQDAFE